VRIGLNVNWEERWICINEPPPVIPQLGVRWTISTDAIVVKGDKHMAVTIKDTEKFSVAISVVDAKGNPAVIDGVPAWSVSDPAGLALVAAADGLSAVITAVGPLGSFQATVEVDADLGVGVKALIGILDVEVVGSEAVAITFLPGVPEPA
jgi:hypothetical protein